jgi:hypothetical protein
VDCPDLLTLSISTSRNLFSLSIQNLLAFMDMVIDIEGGGCFSRQLAFRIIDCSHCCFSLISASFPPWQLVFTGLLLEGRMGV